MVVVGVAPPAPNGFGGIATPPSAGADPELAASFVFVPFVPLAAAFVTGGGGSGAGSTAGGAGSAIGALESASGALVASGIAAADSAAWAAAVAIFGSSEAPMTMSSTVMPTVTTAARPRPTRSAMLGFVGAASGTNDVRDGIIARGPGIDSAV
ncbi:MAG: hypothetical protein JWP87_1631 [Labilithrix sp.]|nr:hypothetical protein [Labilithrix sp.]